MGIPALGFSSAGGIPELIINGKTGFLFEDGADAKDIAEIIEKFYYLSENERETFRENCLNLWKDKLDARKNAKKVVELVRVEMLR